MSFRFSGFLLLFCCISIISCNSKQKNNPEQFVETAQDEDLSIDYNNDENNNTDIITPTDNHNTSGSTLTEVYPSEEDSVGNVFITDQNGNKIMVGQESKAQFSLGLGDITEGAELAMQSSALNCDPNTTPVCSCHYNVNSAECAQYCSQHKDNAYCKSLCVQHPNLSFCQTSSNYYDGGHYNWDDEDHYDWKKEFCEDHPQHEVCKDYHHDDDSDNHRSDDSDVTDALCDKYPHHPNCQQNHQGGSHHIDSDGLNFDVKNAKLSSARLELKALNIEACEKQKFREKHQDLCSGGFTIDGPIVFDLIAETSSPTLDSANIPSAPYKEILLPLEPLKIEGFDENLLNHTAYIDGEFEYEGQTKKFIVRSDFSKDLHFKIDRKEHALIVSPDVSNLFEIRMNPANWFEDIPIEKCLKKGELTFDGDTLIIEDNSAKPRELCKELGRKIIQNMIKSSKMRHH